MLTIIRSSKKVIPTSIKSSKLFFSTTKNNLINTQQKKQNNNNNNNYQKNKEINNYNNNNNNNKNNNNNNNNNNFKNNENLTATKIKMLKFLEKLHPKVKEFFQPTMDIEKKKRDYYLSLSSLLYGVEQTRPIYYLFEDIVENEFFTIQGIKFLFDTIQFKGKNSSILNFIFEQYINYYLNQLKLNSNSNNNNNKEEQQSMMKIVQDDINKIISMVELNKVYFNHYFYNSLLRYYIGIDNREAMGTLIQKILMTQQVEDKTSLSLLVVACLKTDNVASAASLYNKLLSVPNSQSIEAFNEFLNYHLSKNTEESANLAIKLFFRNLNSVPVFLNTNYFLNFINRIFRVSSDQVINEILDLITKKNFVTCSTFLNISINLLNEKDENGNIDQRFLNLSRDIYFQRVRNYKGFKNNEDLSSKLVLWTLLTKDIQELESLLNDINIKTEIHVTQRLLEFVNQEDQSLSDIEKEKLNKMIFKNSNIYSMYLLIIYNEFKGNKKLTAQIEDYLLVKSSGRVKHHTLNFIIQTYLVLDIYHMALNWLSKKVSIYNSSPSSQIYKSFLQYHNEISGNQFLEDFWKTKILNDFKFKNNNLDDENINSNNNNNSNNSEVNNNNNNNDNLSNTIIRNQNTNLKIKIITNTKDQDNFENNQQQQQQQQNNNNNGNNNNSNIVSNNLSIKEKRINLELKWKSFENLLNNPIKFSDIKKINLIPPSFTQNPILSNLFKNEDTSNLDKTIQVLLESLETDQNYSFNSPKFLLPSQFNIIRAYRLIEKHSIEKYIQLLNQSPKYIRSIVFSPEAYEKIFEYDFKLGIETLMNEPIGIQQSQWIYNLLLQYFIKYDHVDLASIIIGKMLQLGKFIMHGEDYLKLVIKKDQHSRAIISPLTTYMMTFYKSPSIANIEIVKMLDLNLYDEALEIFNLAPKNKDSILLGLRIYSKKYPIPPISNLMFWGSLSEIERSIDPNGRVFYENFYRVLYENGLGHIIKLYGEKSNSIKLATPLELHYLLLAESDDTKRLELFKNYPQNKLILTESFELLKSNLNFIPNTQIKQKLESHQIVNNQTLNSNFKQIDSDSIQIIINNFSTFKSDLHDLQILNNENDLKILIKDKE